MKRPMFMATFIVAALAHTPSSVGYALPFLVERCAENNLADEAARQRNIWAVKCFSAQWKGIFEANSQSPRLYALISDDSEASWYAPIDKNAPCGRFTKLQAFCLVGNNEERFPRYPHDDEIHRGRNLEPVPHPGGGFHEP